MPSILTQKQETENPLARSDDHYERLAKDPNIKEFPEGSTYNGYMMNNLQAAPQVPPPVLTGASDNAAQNADVLVRHDKDSEDFINKKWRPLMAYTYMAICIADFILFPILWSSLQAIAKGQVSMPYQPLSLQGGGLLHLAFGAVIGVAAYGRTKEKLESKQI